jgi:hypothetical protein
MEMERETEGPALILYSFGLLDDDLLQIAANFANIYFTAVVGQIRNDFFGEVKKLYIFSKWFLLKQ